MKRRLAGGLQGLRRGWRPLMHEMSLANRHPPDRRGRRARQGFRKVKTVVLEIGQLAAPSPTACASVFDLVMKDSIAEARCCRSTPCPARLVPSAPRRCRSRPCMMPARAGGSYQGAGERRHRRCGSKTLKSNEGGLKCAMCAAAAAGRPASKVKGAKPAYRWWRRSAPARRPAPRPEAPYGVLRTRSAIHAMGRMGDGACTLPRPGQPTPGHEPGPDGQRSSRTSCQKRWLRRRQPPLARRAGIARPQPWCPAPAPGKTSLLVRTIAALQARLAGAGERRRGRPADQLRRRAHPGHRRPGAGRSTPARGCHLTRDGRPGSLAKAPPEGCCSSRTSATWCARRPRPGRGRPRWWCCRSPRARTNPPNTPDMFAAASLMLINKTTCLPHLNFDRTRPSTCPAGQPAPAGDPGFGHHRRRF